MNITFVKDATRASSIQNHPYTRIKVDGYEVGYISPPKIGTKHWNVALAIVNEPTPDRPQAFRYTFPKWGTLSEPKARKFVSQQLPNFALVYGLARVDEQT